MFLMTSEFFTGIQEIDEQHKKLFDIANRAYAVMQDDFITDKFDHINSILIELKDYTKEHFSNEETYMKSIQYKRMFTQKVEHAKFIEKLENIDLLAIEENQNKSILEILDFLVNWLKHHILEVDRLIADQN